ncbi:MAG: hypothetical protein A2161_22430 [Candidatus Schekmanbacteria bacterium RBG_13_48_7]|uniref:Uncharacterized protein n=1 Tax=Candidatus Schekmanbacteria bacterium RBG_13_48_7 TaxID=1817878 RepID=A0A1F7RJA3_9BACT|nr:MAG: hypothetical protein A2161_22430 [Candidatus Schekmanbacteria bacterium RBG_13_48_7]
MGITDDQKKFYQDMLKKAKDDYEGLDSEIQKEVDKVKKRVSQLKGEQKVVLQMYSATCARLGIKNDLQADLDELEADEAKSK